MRGYISSGDGHLRSHAVLSTGRGHRDGQEAASDCAHLRSSGDVCLLSSEGSLISGQLFSTGLLVPTSDS